ncbi:DNRLRE domain-containing protein [Bacteroidota bacterium]
MKRIIPLFIVFVVCYSGLSAQKFITLNPSRDNTIYSEKTGNSNGKGDHLFAGATNNLASRRALLYFDLKDTLPAGITIDSVSLSLMVNKCKLPSATSIKLHRLNASWGEGLSKAKAEEGQGMVASPGDATWIYSFFDTVSWDKAGGDFESTEATVRSISGTGPVLLRGTGLLADVKYWLEDGSKNHGWILIGDEDSKQSSKRFSSRENPTEEERPKLTIYYSDKPVYTKPVNQAGQALQAFPNPFIDEVTIQYQIRKTESVRVEVYNLLGQQIQLISNGKLSPGRHQFTWDGTDLSGKSVPNGMYYIILSRGEDRQVTKIMKTR